MTGKFLRKWRPLALEAPPAPKNEGADKIMNGINPNSSELR